MSLVPDLFCAVLLTLWSSWQDGTNDSGTRLIGNRSRSTGEEGTFRRVAPGQDIRLTGRKERGYNPQSPCRDRGDQCGRVPRAISVKSLSRLVLLPISISQNSTLPQVTSLHQPALVSLLGEISYSPLSLLP